MAEPECPHADTQTPRRVCIHLFREEQDAEGFDLDGVLRFSGEGLEYWLTCRACKDAQTPDLAAVCDTCFDEMERCPGVFVGVRGTPEILQRRSGLQFAHRKIDLPGLVADELIAFAPLAHGRRSSWVALRADGTLLRLDLDRPASSEVCSVDLTELGARAPFEADPSQRQEQAARWSGRYFRGDYFVEPSPDGRFVAVVATRGPRGLVVDVASGLTTLRLDRGAYHVEASEFPVAFLVDESLTVVIHASDWNRLDMADAATGALLSARSPTSYREGEPAPHHYLGYFHGALLVAPDGSHVVDDGWSWHPTGSLHAFNCRRWLHENPWESEDGPSVRVLRYCNYFWDGPKCFVDDRTLAVWGYGPDDEAMTDAAVIFDVVTGRRLRWFAGPPRGRFFFDDYLIVSAEGPGTSVWDVATGERLHEDPALTLLAHNRSARTFLGIGPDGTLRESRLEDTDGRR